MNNNLKRRVMARIYFEYTKNVLFEYPDYFMFVLFVSISFMMVSISDVISNMPKDDLSSFFNFFKVAVIHTNWIMQALIVGFLVRTVAIGFKFANKKVVSRWLLIKPIKLGY